MCFYRLTVDRLLARATCELRRQVAVSFFWFIDGAGEECLVSLSSFSLALVSVHVHGLRLVLSLGCSLASAGCGLSVTVRGPGCQLFSQSADPLPLSLLGVLWLDDALLDLDAESDRPLRPPDRDRA